MPTTITAKEAREQRKKKKQERENKVNSIREQRKQKIIELMKLGFNQAEIGEELGICRQRVNQYITRKEFRELQLQEQKQRNIPNPDWVTPKK